MPGRNARIVGICGSLVEVMHPSKYQMCSVLTQLYPKTNEHEQRSSTTEIYDILLVSLREGEQR